MHILKNHKIVPRAFILSIISASAIFLSSCGAIDNTVNELNGSITGNTYIGTFYSNDGTPYLTVSGKKIDFDNNIIEEKTYNAKDGWGYTKTLSSVITLAIDGKNLNTCGSTFIFAEKGLEPDVTYPVLDTIESTTDDSLDENVIIAKVVNEFKNYYGKPVIVVVQSQLGDPICAYSGDSVYEEVCEDLPKTTKLMIDGKALYIHRANYLLIDKDLISE